MEILVPRHALVVLVGAAGCGKSTWAAARFTPTQIVSSDECRALVSDDPNDPRASADAFALMHVMIGMRLKRGRLTVADATNVTADKREALLDLASTWRRPVVAVVFDLPEAVCQERNKARAERTLPPHAIKRQLRLARESLPKLKAEGFSAIWVLRSVAQADGAVVVREDGETQRLGG